MDMIPDDLVSTHGEGLTLTRVVDYDVGPDGVQNVVRETVDIQGYVSNPSEEQEQRLEGRLEAGAITVTVGSGVDIAADRDGGRDRLVRPATEDVTTTIEGDIYTVVEVQRDTHPIAGIEKTTVVCNVLDRKDLSDDADSYQ